MAVTGGIDDTAGQPVVLTLHPITPGWGHVNYSLNPDIMQQEGSTLHFQLHGCKLIIN